jgi:amidase
MPLAFAAHLRSDPPDVPDTILSDWRTSPPWLAGSACELAARIRSGALTSEAAVAACLARIAAVNPSLNAVVQLRADAALDEARAADRAMADGGKAGALHGVPITVKDSFDTAGTVSTGGTLGRRTFVPTADATIVARLKAAGAIVLGKTNTPELTLAYEADNLVYGRTCNPYDLSRGTGGSSGGSAAIVAACGSPLDVGSDTAGSIRFPAHCCGVAGLKPTSGRVPRTGHIIGPGGLQQWLTTIGPIARRVEDLELALGIIAGPDDGDPHIVPVPLRASASVDLRGLHAALFVDTALAPATPDVREAVMRAAHALGAAGVEVEQATLPAFERPFEFFPQLFGADGAAGLEGFLAFLGTREVSPQVQGAISLMRPHAMSSAALGDLMLAIDLWRAQALAFMRRYDLIVCPAAADVAPRPVTDWNDPAVSWNAGIFPYLVPFNFIGAPSVVVRAGATPSGLPIGVQCVAPPWREDVALRAASHIEAALGGWQPPQGPRQA